MGYPKTCKPSKIEDKRTYYLEMNSKGVSQCRFCDLVKPIEEFDRPQKANGYPTLCKECRRKRDVRYRKANSEHIKNKEKAWRERRKEERPDEVKETYLRKSLKYNYKLTLEEYEELSISQGGKCGICKEFPTDGKRLDVDHDHSCCPSDRSCGKCVRGLLCTVCNLRIGAIEGNLTEFKEWISKERIVGVYVED